MRHWITSVTEAALVRMVEHVELVGLANTDEFTFRAFFMAAAARQLDKPSFQTEWRKFDLLAQTTGEATLIEFKYYLLRPKYELDGQLAGYKGGASKQNEREFRQCLAKLQNAIVPGISERFLTLIYQRDYEKKRAKLSYHLSYNDWPVTSPISEIWPLARGPFETRIFRIAP